MSLIIYDKVDEIKLIRTYQKSHNENIALYFFNKYKDEILNIVFWKINKKFSSIPLEKEDFLHIVWTSVVKSLKSFKCSKNNDFKSFLVNKTYMSSVKEALKFISNSHIVLNTAYSYDKIISQRPYFNFGPNSKVTIDNSYKLATDKFIDNIIKFNKRYDTEYLKRLIYLKSLGYSVQEISKITKLSKHEVQKVIDFICEIAKKLYF